MTDDRQADEHQNLHRSALVWVFLAFAFAYFLSTLVRASTATLAPVLSAELGLQARDLGLLAGAYFLGFSLTQLPMGRWLDRHGPRKVLCLLLCMAVLGSLTYAFASGFYQLLLARFLTGVGVSACLMGPLTGFRRWLSVEHQVRANSWMLTVGALGMLTSTLPIHWLLGSVGWRPIFLGVSVLTVVAIIWIGWQVPAWHEAAPKGVATAPARDASPELGLWRSYSPIWRDRYFQRMIPVGFFIYGGTQAMLTLWTGPWLISVSNYTAAEAATGLFWINVVMLVTFMGWGFISPWLAQRGWGPNRLIAMGLPLHLLALFWLVLQGPGTGTMAWAVYFVTGSFVAVAQPAIGMAFPKPLAGRALSAFNLMIFSGVFVNQWVFGAVVDWAAALGSAPSARFQWALSVLGVTMLGSMLWFICYRTDDKN